MSRLASVLAQHAGLSDNEIWLASIGGFLHDLGKIAMPDSVLRKTDHLTDDEYATVRTHQTSAERSSPSIR
ncbi:MULTISPECIES: HD-GYP domain-containing protein [Paraburkholderia]|uniref:HD-GYP domain-containing protein n=1 Tax=Paraburkholderia TaxID=1822464 RepID=UPI00351EDE23